MFPCALLLSSTCGWEFESRFNHGFKSGGLLRTVPSVGRWSTLMFLNRLPECFHVRCYYQVFAAESSNPATSTVSGQEVYYVPNVFRRGSPISTDRKVDLYDMLGQFCLNSVNLPSKGIIKSSYQARIEVCWRFLCSLVNREGERSAASVRRPCTPRRGSRPEGSPTTSSASSVRSARCLWSKFSPFLWSSFL